MAVELRLFGRTGVRVSNLCLGTMLFGTRTTPAESYDIQPNRPATADGCSADLLPSSTENQWVADVSAPSCGSRTRP